MKCVSIATAGIAMVMATNAFAADLAPRSSRAAYAMVDPGLNWTGFYAGVNGGYSWGRANTAVAPFAGPFPTPPFAPFGQNVDGGLGGGQAGYAWQVDPKWLVGLEGDIQGTGERSSVTLTSVGPRYGSFDNGLPNANGPDFNSIATQTTNLSHDLQWCATFRGRAGFLADPQTLLYATGGLALGGLKYSAQTTTSVQVFTPFVGTTPNGPPIIVAGAGVSSSDIRVGWTVGAGIERKFSPNWSAKLEYLYMDFGTKTYFAGIVNQASVSLHDQVLRAGINYAFALAPASAR